jgi:hypothetical protein
MILKEKETAGLIPSLKLTETLDVPGVSENVGLIVNTPPENVTKDGYVLVVVTVSESASEVPGSV